jgi:hypothetical protein
VVAKHLARGGDPVAALRSYETERIPPTRSVAKLAGRSVRPREWKIQQPSPYANES